MTEPQKEVPEIKSFIVYTTRANLGHNNKSYGENSESFLTCRFRPVPTCLEDRKEGPSVNLGSKTIDDRDVYYERGRAVRSRA